MKMKKKQKRLLRKKIHERKDFIGLYQEIGWAGFDEIQDNDSTLNEGANSRANRVGRGGSSWVVVQRMP